MRICVRVYLCCDVPAFFQTDQHGGTILQYLGHHHGQLHDPVKLRWGRDHDQSQGFLSTHNRQTCYRPQITKPVRDKVSDLNMSFTYLTFFVKIKIKQCVQGIHDEINLS